MLLFFSSTLFAQTPVKKFNRQLGIELLGDGDEAWDFRECILRLKRSRMKLQSSPGRHSMFLNGRARVILYFGIKNLNRHKLAAETVNRGMFVFHP